MVGKLEPPFDLNQVSINFNPILRALTEVIPHFFVNMVLSLENSDEIVIKSEESNPFPEVPYLSKWNQINNIVGEDEALRYAEKYDLLLTMNWEEPEQFGERFNIIQSFLKQGTNCQTF